MSDQAIDEGSFTPLAAQAAPAQPNAAPSSAPGIDEGSFVPLSAVPSQNTPVQPPEQSTLSEVGDVASDVATGVAKGAGQTVNTISGLLNKIPGVGKYLAPTTGINAATQIETPTNTAQKVGVGAEGVAEFFLGDEALKGLTIAERASLLTKIAKVAEEHPVVDAIIKKGVQAVRQGTVAAGQQMAHGATPTDAAETGVEAAALGTGVGVAAEGAGVVGRRVGQAYTESRAVPQIDIDREAIKSASMRGVQPKMMSGLRSMMKSLESEAGIEKPVGAAPEAPAEQQSIRDAVKQTSDNFLTRAKSVYASLDKATGGQFQRFDNQLREVNDELNKLVSTPDEASMNQEAELDSRRAAIEEARDAAFDRAKAQGVDPNLVESARADFKRGQALKDLDYSIKKVASGGRPGPDMLPSDLAKDPEMLHPERLQKRLDTMYDSGRLQEAVGNENADRMIADASKNKVQVQQTAREALDSAQRNANTVRDAAARRIAKNKGIRYATDAAGLAAVSQIPVVGPAIQKAAQAATHVFIPGVGIQPTQ